MIKGAALVDIKDFQNKNNANVEAVSDSVYKLALDSLTSDKMETIEKSFKALEENFEVISNAIDLGSSIDSEMCYNFGRIVAATELVLDLINFKDLSCSLEQISKNYPLLLPALEAIKEQNTISGSELQKKLGLKASSNLSNFLKRIDKYELVHVKKIGTTNYLSLTRKGEQLLSKNKRKALNSNEEHVPLQHVYTLLDEMSDEIGKLNPNTIRVLHSFSADISNQEKRLLKHKIDMIFQASVKFKLTKIKKMLNTSVDGEYINQSRDDKSDTMITYEHYLYGKKEESYV